MNAGDKVQIRDWDEMEREFGLNRNGSIACRRVFTKDMCHLCGKTHTLTMKSGAYIELDGAETRHWRISTDMIKPYTPLDYL